MCGQDDDEEVVGNLSYVLALALEHRLDSPGKGLPESVTDLMRRITEAASDILSDWNIGKTGGLKRGREFVVICDSVAGTKREGRR